MALELKPKGIACCSIYPGSVATEFILEWAGKRGSDLSTAQTTLGVGRAIAALAVAPDLMERSGSIQWIEDISEQFDVRDENGNLAPRYPGRIRG
jgi:NAD(P)-dependent dehydrogenase (short-subunit alcohol dehydrogenase family)